MSITNCTGPVTHSTGVSVLLHYLCSRAADNCWTYVPVKWLRSMSLISVLDIQSHYWHNWSASSVLVVYISCQWLCGWPTAECFFSHCLMMQQYSKVLLLHHQTVCEKELQDNDAADRIWPSDYPSLSGIMPKQLQLRSCGLHWTMEDSPMTRSDGRQNLS